MTGELPCSDIDHKDNNRSNNSFDNLRLATKSQNSGNMRKKKNTRSKLKGVSYSKQSSKWFAQITHKNHRYYLGAFSTPIEAHAAYCRAARKLFKEFSNFG